MRGFDGVVAVPGNSFPLPFVGVRSTLCAFFRSKGWVYWIKFLMRHTPVSR